MEVKILLPDAARSGYYVAELPEPDSMQNDPWGIWWYEEIDTWCNLTFGSEDLWGAAPISGWKRMRNKYCFTQPEILSWFLMRWL